MVPARSVLFLPASNPRAVEKARTLPCDVAILDLEDAVAPEAKAAARLAAVQALASGAFGPRVGVRINGLDTPWGEDDLKALGGTGISLVVAPKVEDAAAVLRLGALLPPRSELWAMIETPRALLELPGIAGAAARTPLEGLMLGVNDLALGLGTAASTDREPLKPWLAAVVAAARAHGLRAIDGVFNAFTDREAFEAECRQARLFGFDGKSLIHPSQIETANAAFTPSADEVEQARAIVAAFAAPEAQGSGALRLGDRMVERLHLDAAERLLARLDPRA